MKQKSSIVIIAFLLFYTFSTAQTNIDFMADLTREVIDSSRIRPGEGFSGNLVGYGPNNSGITLIRPGGRDCYPAFWIRDYAMSLESGFISAQEQKDIIIYTAARQADSTWTSNTGSLIPEGSIPDHIRINDGLPIYFPGTYSYENQGAALWRLPPYGDQYFFIHMVWYYITLTDDWTILNLEVNEKTIMERMISAFNAVPSDPKTALVTIDTAYQTCDFGFRDIVTLSGKVAFGSILKFRAAKELDELVNSHKRNKLNDSFAQIARAIQQHLPETFADPRGFLRASTGLSSQADVWATAFAVYTGALQEPYLYRACRALSSAYTQGNMVKEGQIRHVLTTDDFSVSTAWEIAASPVNRYQNGAYWGTPTGWVAFAIHQVNPDLARQLAEEYISHLRESDFRINHETHGGPYECIFPDDDYSQNPVYMTSVSVPYAAFLRMGLQAPSGQDTLRTKQYISGSKESAIAWQNEVRAALFDLLMLNDLLSQKDQIDLNPEWLLTKDMGQYLWKELTINSTPGRRIKVILTIPKNREGKYPAVVCIHGHGGQIGSVYDTHSIYNGFAHELASNNYVTITTVVSQHEVYEDGMLLMGERLWDLIRCIDFLETLPEVDAERIGCGGLSLGGEMAMWLGGMDTRMKATLSAGFLTKMDHMEQNHCMCWKFPGLRTLVDYADIYALTAPRPLQCQNGLKEPESQFYVPLAREAMKEIKPIYVDMEHPENLELLVHPEGHVVDLEGALRFFDQQLLR